MHDPQRQGQAGSMSLFGKRVYVTLKDDPMFGLRQWDDRYDGIDRAMMRPIHKDMSVAPPWAKSVRL